MRHPTLVPVILCGGIGSRLWPLSRRASPKPFQKLTTERPMLVETLARTPETLGGADIAAPLVICSDAHSAMVRGAMMVSDDSDGWVITEPEGKNTAPAIALAAHFAIEQEGDDALILISPSDHDIGDLPAFHAAIQNGLDLAKDGYLVTFGIKPDRAETGYGYIRLGHSLLGGYAVSSFTEKPDEAGAEALIGEGALWNSGMFLLPAKAFLEAIQKYRPEMAEHCQNAWQTRTEAGKHIISPGPEAWIEIVGDSIDYAVMQETDRAAVVAVDMQWSDIGSFASLHEQATKDSGQNALRGGAVLEQSRGNLVLSESGRTVTLVGCEDMVVVDTPDAVLIVPREKAQDVRTLHAHLKAIGRDDLL